MNKMDAKKIAKSGILISQVVSMLERARQDGQNVSDRRSRVNKGLTKEQAFRILFNAHVDKDPDRVIKSTSDVLGAQNAIREFGDFWGGE